MKHIDDEKLLMVYLGEASQEETDAVLQSKQACEQLDQLEADMQAIENASNAHNQNPLPADYGQQLWHQIADQLESPAENKVSWWHKLQSYMLQPHYSLASFVLVAGLVMVAFWAGRQQVNGGIDGQLQEQLLAQNIQLHLTQSEIFLTQVSNGNGTSTMQSTAQRLLTSNRIFKQALANYEGQFTQQILKNLEPVLLEYANNPANQIHGQQPAANWVNNSTSNDLMFQIKTMKKQLAEKNDII
ncbi:hypothetical protein OS175_05660 [Marinicella sp. S1101]|uniref:hypothetical protein n=1 Tax=Marinicella marina TaxID=2996016 RepID=UPI002260DF1A|nr:hypothetical protein [Marinicella marina]MCX7553357.1 hypothetical protein [Marinicella marina]MDJ1139089.1 hypothetical protein [Marinicella marina]